MAVGTPGGHPSQMGGTGADGGPLPGQEPLEVGLEE